MHKVLVLSALAAVMSLPFGTKTDATTLPLLGNRVLRTSANGAGVIVFPAHPPLSVYSNIGEPAFTPNGDMYFAFGVFGNPVARFSPDGTYSSVPNVKGVSYKIIYAHGALWAGTIQGIVEFSPDGQMHRSYDLHAPIENGISDGPDGSIYATSSSYNRTTKSLENLFFQVGGHGGIKRYTLPVRPLGPLAMGADSKAWFSYENDATQAYGIARVETDGSVKLFPVTGEGVGLQAAYSLIANRGSLYFTFISDLPPVVPSSATYVFGRIAPDGTITELQLPYQTPAAPISADKGGNIWMFLETSAGVALFFYDTYNGRYTQIYETGTGMGSQGPFVGPDDNVYFFGPNANDSSTAIEVYTRQLQTLEPQRVVLATGKTTPITILETKSNGPWTARSLNPLVAIVSSPSSKTGDFNLIGKALGTTSIAVTDRLGNAVYATVTTQ